MTIDTNTFVSMTEANQNFSKFALKKNLMSGFIPSRLHGISQ